MKPNFYHVLISRFSVRLNPEGAFRGRTVEWLFDLSRLQKKLVFFEHVTLASVIASTSKPDLYIILVDEELPIDILKPLQDLIAPYDWIQTRKIPPGFLGKMSELGSILGHLKVPHSYILTTNLDDDDAIGRHYLQNLATQAAYLISRKVTYHWFGSIDMYEWDVIPSEKAEYGFLKPYSGGVLFTLSTGFSVLTANFPAGPTIFTLSHSRCLDFLTRSHRRKNYDKWARFRFRFRLFMTSLKSKKFRAALLLLEGHDFATRLDFKRPGDFEGLIINHGDNLQVDRIDGGKENRITLDPEILESKFGAQARMVVQKLYP
jgi:hypothetical protein